MTAPTLDTDGYPTEETLETIRGWDWKDPIGWFEFIEAVWWHAKWGIAREERADGSMIISMSTGGWSGNESIISAMMDNNIWTFYWESSRRGGHYTFELPARFFAEETT